MNKIYLLIFSILLLVSCNRQKDILTEKKSVFLTDTISYAKGFSIEKHENFHVVKLNNPWKEGFVLQTYILFPKSQALPENLPEGIIIRTPLDKTISFSSVTCGYFEELGVLNTLAGVAEPQYINIPFINEAIKKGEIADIGQAANPDIEKIILTEPEAIFTNPINDSGVNSLNKLDVPVINCFEYMETHPLGQTEWIRFIGLLFDKKELADSLFYQTVQSYNELKALTQNMETRPSVFTELKYGDFWYMPGGESYMAHLFKDAGASYILKENTNPGSVSLSFEMVLDKAENADFWLFKYYSSHNITYKRLKTDYSNYALFKAYKEKNIYACNTLITSNYYQELPLHPDWLLKDMIWIFHPNLLPEYQPRYYNPLTD